MINIRQILIGLSVLFFGILVYIVDRPFDQTYFLYKSFLNLSLHNSLPNLFGNYGNYLPSFIHVYSFIIITASFFPPQKKGYLLISVCWFGVDIFFELGQKFKSLFSAMVPDWFSFVPFLEVSKNYFLAGTFDFNDLAAISFGALLGYFTLLITTKGMKHET